MIKMNDVMSNQEAHARIVNDWDTDDFKQFASESRNEKECTGLTNSLLEESQNALTVYNIYDPYVEIDFKIRLYDKDYITNESA